MQHDALRTQMYQLKAQYDRRQIDEATYEAQVRALGRSCGEPCQRCPDGIAVVRHGGANICADCYQG